jgi:hypothetical protein
VPEACEVTKPPSGVLVDLGSGAVYLGTVPLILRRQRGNSLIQFSGNDFCLSERIQNCDKTRQPTENKDKYSWRHSKTIGRQSSALATCLTDRRGIARPNFPKYRHGQWCS